MKHSTENLRCLYCLESLVLITGWWLVHPTKLYALTYVDDCPGSSAKHLCDAVPSKIFVGYDIKNIPANFDANAWDTRDVPRGEE